MVLNTVMSEGILPIVKGFRHLRVRNAEKRMKELEQEEFASMTPKDMLDHFLYHYKNLNRKLTQSQYQNLIEQCKELKYGRELDSDGYPLDLEMEVLSILQGFAIEKLGYDYDYVDYNGLD